MPTLQEIIEATAISIPYMGTPDIHLTRSVLEHIAEYIIDWGNLNLYFIDDKHFDDIHVEIKARTEIDHRRSTSVYVIYYQNIPVIVCTCSGRSESDTVQHYIVNKDMAHKMFISLLPCIEDESDVNQNIDINYDKNEVTLGEYIHNMK